MQTIQDAIEILTAQQKPLAEKLKTIEQNYRAEREAVLSQLKPLNKALKTLTPKQPKAPKPAKADKAAAKASAKEAAGAK